jgi:Sel1 repeat
MTTTVTWEGVPLEDLRAAAERGDAGAQFEMGRKTENGDVAGAARWYLAAAEQGHAEAQGEVGVCFYRGKGVDKDFEQALKWYRKGADQGDAQSQFSLGACFQSGNGVAQDEAEAVSWYRKAAEQGDAHGQYLLGLCFYDGDGVDKNLAEAASWWRKAAEQGNAEACEFYGGLLMKGDSVPRDCDEALKWLRKCPDSRQTREKIDEIEDEADALASKTNFRKVVARIRAGNSVFGKTHNADTLLHTAAANLAIEPVALLLEHPLFDALVVQTNNAGQLARDVVGDEGSFNGKKRGNSRVIASALSCRRSTRAACLLWCLEQAASFPVLGRHMVLPREIGELIAHSVVSPLGGAVAELLPYGAAKAQLTRSVQSSWRHVIARDTVTALRKRLAVAEAEVVRIRVEIDAAEVELAAAEGRVLPPPGDLVACGTKRSAEELQDGSAHPSKEDDGRRDSKRSRGDTC